MATQTILTCDFPMRGESRCGELAEESFEGYLGVHVFRMDVCKKHQTAFERRLVEFGMSAQANTGRKRRGAYVAHSGKVFNSADVRQWLRESGHEQGAQTGRLPDRFIEEYAAAH